MFVEKVATMAEIRGSWSIARVLQANAYLDYRIDVDHWQRPPPRGPQS